MASRKEKERKRAEEEAEAAAEATGGTTEPTQSTPSETSLDRLARMFESFMEIQRARDDKMEKESAKQAHQVSVLNHQVTQLQLDLERERGTTPIPSREPTPVPPAATTRGGKGYKLRMAKLEDGDNIEHYLTTFERLATACEWPKEDWAIHLIPLLTGKARSAFIAMNPDTNLDYDELKEAILKKYEINAETYRLQFRALEISQDETPQELYVRLKDLFCKWTKFAQCSKEDLLETLVLEQYLRVLYPEVKTWVKERNPATAAQAAQLVENYVAAHKGPRSYRYAGMLDRQARGASSLLSDVNPITTVIPLAIVLGASLAILLTVLCKRKRNKLAKKYKAPVKSFPDVLPQYHNKPEEQRVSVAPVQNSRPPSLLIVYSNSDGPAHVRVVLHLAAFLQRHMAIKVFLDLWESLSLMEEGELGWYCNKIVESDYVLVICSPGLHPRPQEKNDGEEHSPDQSMIPAIVAIIGEELCRTKARGQDLSRYMTAIFDYTKETDVPAVLGLASHYTLPTDFPLLFSHLHGVALRQPGTCLQIEHISEDYSKLPAGEALQRAIQEAKTGLSEQHECGDVK